MLLLWYMFLLWQISADLQRVNFSQSKAFRLDIANAGTVGCSQLILHAERLHADSFRPESTIAMFAWHHTEENKVPLSEESQPAQQCHLLYYKKEVPEAGQCLWPIC